MGYYFSNSVKTLTHWQSGKAGGGEKAIPRSAPIFGFVHDGEPYFTPMAMWDSFAIQGEAGVVEGKKYWGNTWSLFSGAKLILSARQYSTDGKYTHFRGIFEVEGEHAMKWGTATVVQPSPIEIAARDGSGSMYILSGQKYGIAVPVFKYYFLAEGSCEKGKENTVPTWMQNFTPSAKPFDSFYDTPAALMPSLWKNWGKIAGKDKVLSESDYSGVDATDLINGFSQVKQDKLYFKAGGVNPTPTPVGVVEKGQAGVGSEVKVWDTTPAKYEVIWGGGVIDTQKYGPLTGTTEGGTWRLTITREPVKYELTHGIIWKQPE